MTLEWDKKTMLQILANKTDVPNYQRGFAWDQDQIIDFFIDLKTFVNSDDDDEYLFGQVIMHKEGDVRHIVDGQQRICTSVIFLKILHSILSDISLEDAQDKKRTNLLNKIEQSLADEDDDALYTKYRFRVGESYAIFFNKYVLDGNKKSKTGNNKTNKRVKKAYDVLYELLQDDLNGLSDFEKYEAIRTYFDKFTGKFYVSYVESSNLGQAYTIFETLNARGKSLDSKDLVKNYLISHHDAEETALVWKEIEDKVNGAGEGNKDYMSLYLRYYWNSGYKFVRNKGLYRAISKKLDESPGSVKQFLSDLSDIAPFFASVLRSEPSEKITDKSAKIIHNLQKVQAISFYPIVIAMYRNENIGKEDVEKILSAVETLVIRNQVIMGYVANRNEMLFSDLACKLFNNTNVDTVVDEIHNKTANDDEIRGKFQTYCPKDDAAKFILRAIYDSWENETQVDENNIKVQLEHIMPRNGENWDVDPKIHKEYVRRMGNLTLITGKFNVQMKNLPFDEKKKYYQNSKYPDTNKLAFMDKWGVDEIESRQKEICDHVIEKWPLLTSVDSLSEPTLDFYLEN